MEPAGDLPLFGVYVHWPFCASKCPYCDFNSHVSESIDHGAWRDAFLREIDYYAALTPGRRVTSIFFGGGTPSLMAPETVQAVIDRVQQRWHIANDCEITLEANPTSVEADKFRAFRQAGVNRVSLGVQALDDTQLQFLGRKHNVSEAIQAIDIARKNFDRFSFDLIYARPKQSVNEWRQELEIALTLSGGHLSLYQLTIEQGTPFFGQHARGEFTIPDDDHAGELYETTQAVLEDAGMPAYEISNHAVPGQESRHNLTYWRYDDYAGIGPGAHGRLTIDGVKQATRGHRAPQIWLDRAANDGHGGHPFEEIDPQQCFSEALMMGLRLRDGVLLRKLSEAAGGQYDLDEARLAALEQEGLIWRTDERLAATAAGRQRLNALLRYLL
ncbi:MAG: coproporphyrinogen III oxidase [Rhodospirillales bacterium]|nr:coproporphyrinogen III oxidase [Rhodospirillales bacterium]MCB9995193.1 coproporphyrinogen III oxidase [Rhodospirillales bacterium]